MAMDAQELKDIIEKHGKWLRNEDGGEKANLRFADLSFADLSSIKNDFTMFTGYTDKIVVRRRQVKSEI